MIIPKIKIEHVLILVLAVLLLLGNCTGEPKEGTTEKTTITTEKVTVVDSSRNSGIKNRVPVKVEIIENPDSIEIVPKGKQLSSQDQEKVKEANRYIDTTHFKGSRVISDIISEGRILQHELKIEVDHLQTTITTEKTTVKKISGLFFSPGVSLSPLGVESVEANFNYIHKGSFGIGAGVYYHTMTNHTGLKLTIHKKIW